MRRFLPAVALLLLCVPDSRFSTSPVSAQGQGLAYGRPEVSPAVYHDVSQPLRDLPNRPPISTRADFEVKRPAEPAGQAGPDTALQTTAVAALGATTGAGFNGVGEGADFSFNVNYAPPDTVGEAGLTQYVQWVNVSFAVFDKAGNLLKGPTAGNSLWQGFPGDCATRNDGDPIVQYDQLADRWIMTQFAVGGSSYLQCVAISQTSDATGAWYRYAFSYDQFPDYPKLSVWPDAYYISFNMFRSGVIFTGSRVCAYDRARMLQGLSATQQCFQVTNAPSLLPADLEGKTLPPAGTPNYFLNRSGSSLNLWKFHVDFANSANTTLTGPTNIAVAGYSTACGGGTCIPQASTTNQLDSLGDRLMYRLGYRNLGGGHEALVVNHSVAADTRTGIRWYEIDVQGGTPSVHQQGTYAPNDGLYRWMGSAAMDAVGNIAVGYSVSSATTRPSIRFAGHENGIQGPGELSLETDMMTGTGSQTGTLTRWGDYSTLSIDPTDDCTFWYTTEYLQANGSFNWSTRVGSFKFTSCTGGGGGGTPDFTLGATPSSRTITQGQSTTYDVTVTGLNGYNASGTFSILSGLPASIGASFSPTTYSGGNGSSILTITTDGSSQTGTFQLTIQASDGSLSHTANVTLVVNPPQTADFSISVSPGSRNVKKGQTTTFTVTLTPAGGFNSAVDLTLASSPAGVTGTFSPSSLPGSGSSTLTIPTASLNKGTYALTITGTGGGKTHSVTANLRVR